ncbi:unnamed protein product [Spirodela intermedia]|uniref:Uncharacterized protein n=1 Tax=Spirodela intermedia TaxID=51605 RepID=A0A7I8J0E5_SPIIN|nr:unnamed protein product [Spirodela intermedia]CAA6662901.1 unnamed protein product [Spirodela intermedia]
MHLIKFPNVLSTFSISMLVWG